MTHATPLFPAAGRAGLAELVWTAPGGAAPRAIGVVPLLLGDAVAVALPWAYEEQARAAAASPSAAIVLSEPRLGAPGWEPVAGIGRLLLVEDGEGEVFGAQLLEQEVRKHPPARALCGSLLLRREHWWYLPRLVLVLEPQRVVPVGPREGPQDAVLAVDDDGLQLATVRVADWDADPVDVAGGPDAHGPAVLVGQEVSTPDAERWTVHVTSGRYADGRLQDVQRPPTRELEAVPGLRARVRRQRDLERSCVRALRTAGHG